MTHLSQTIEATDATVNLEDLAGDDLDFHMSANTSGPTTAVVGRKGNYKAEFRISVKNTGSLPRRARILYTGGFVGQSLSFRQTKTYDVGPGATRTIREAFPVSHVFKKPGTFEFKCQAAATDTDVARDSYKVKVRPNS